MKHIFSLQMTFFLVFGLVSGSAIMELYDYKLAQARMQTEARILLSLPIKALSEIRITKGLGI